MPSPQCIVFWPSGYLSLLPSQRYARRRLASPTLAMDSGIRLRVLSGLETICLLGMATLEVRFMPFPPLCLIIRRSYDGWRNEPGDIAVEYREPLDWRPVPGSGTLASISRACLDLTGRQCSDIQRRQQRTYAARQPGRDHGAVSSDSVPGWCYWRYDLLSLWNCALAYTGRRN